MGALRDRTLLAVDPRRHTGHEDGVCTIHVGRQLQCMDEGYNRLLSPHQYKKWSRFSHGVSKVMALQKRKAKCSSATSASQPYASHRICSHRERSLDQSHVGLSDASSHLMHTLTLWPDLCPESVSSRALGGMTQFWRQPF
jgi:hypothetical protein